MTMDSVEQGQGYLPLRSSWKHQAEASRRLEGKRSFALFMAMRTGKTKVVLDDFGRLELAGEVKNLLVIAPAGVYRTWEVAVRDHASMDLQTRLLIHTWKSGMTKKKEEEIERFMKSLNRPRLLLLNVEAVSSVKDARDLCEKFLKSGPSMFVVDESTVIKNESSKRGSFIVDKLAPLASYRRILTGLPTPQSPLDAFNQFEFLEPGCLGHATFSTFKARYAIEEKICVLPNAVLAEKLKKNMGTDKMDLPGIGTVSIGDLNRASLMRELDKRRVWYQAIPRIKGYKNEEELKNKMAPLSYRVLLEECYDLPPKMYSVRDVDMTAEQMKTYADIRDRSIHELETADLVVAANVIARMLRCHQVLCGHVRDEFGKLHEIPEKRTKALIDLLLDYSGKAIVWCSYDYNIGVVRRELEKKFGEGSTAAFWGGNMGKREEEEKRFKTSPECRFMVATAAAGGRGRTWREADLVVYYSNTNNLEHRDQSEERAQMIDKVSSVQYIDLVVPGTVDEKIIHALRKKIDMAATITGDNWREWVV